MKGLLVSGLRAKALLRPALSTIHLPQSFNDRGVGHAAAFAHGLQSLMDAGTFQFVEQCGHQPRASRARGMPERYGAAVDVDAREIREGRDSERAEQVK
jgi:hypothetical protein